MKSLKDYLGKKKPEKGDETKKEAKMDVLKDLRGMASGMMKDGMKDKVVKATVVADSKDDLEKGLDKAKKVVGGMPAEEEMEEMLGKDLDGDNEEGESPEHKAKVLAEDCESPEDIDAMIRALEDKKRELMRG